MRDAPAQRAGASAWKIRPGWYEVVLRLEEAAVGTAAKGGGPYIADQLARMRRFRRASFAPDGREDVRFEIEILARSVAAADAEAREALQDLLLGEVPEATFAMTTLRVAWLSEMSAES